MKFAKTKAERRIVFIELANLFNEWNAMTDDQLMARAKESFPAISGTPDRGMLLKYLTLHKLDEID